MIKNINVVFDLKNDKNPKGLNNADLNTLSSITNNYVENIDCIELDKFDIAERHKVLVTAIQKLAIRGVIQLKFINLDLLGNKISKTEMTGQQYSKLLPNINSCWSHLECLDVISQSKLKIQNIYYDNVYTIIKLEKV